MVCIDQTTAQKDEEPYVTLSKTRTIGGRVLFGQHATHVPVEGREGVAGIKVGDLVRVWAREEEDGKGGIEARRTHRADGPRGSRACPGRAWRRRFR